jgi:integrase
MFLLLTGARRSEAANLPWTESSGTDWALPPARNKTGNKTKVDLIRPLSDAAQAVLANVARFDKCDFVFTVTGKGPIRGLAKFKADFDKASGVTGWTLHDLRRTARSLMSRAQVPSDHAERCLGHVIRGVRKIYDRHEYYEEKKQAFAALAALIERIIDPQDNVVALRSTATSAA